MEKLRQKDFYFSLAVAVAALTVCYVASIRLGFYYADDFSAFTPGNFAELWHPTIYLQKLGALLHLEFVDAYGTRDTIRIFGVVMQILVNRLSVDFGIPIRDVYLAFNLLASVPLLIFFRLSVTSTMQFYLASGLYFTGVAQVTQFFWLINVAYLPITFCLGMLLLVQHLEHKHVITRALSISLAIPVFSVLMLTTELAVTVPLTLMVVAYFVYGNSRPTTAACLNIAVLAYLVLYVAVKLSQPSQDGSFYEQFGAAVAGPVGQLLQYCVRLVQTFVQIIVPINAYNSVLLLTIHAGVSLFLIAGLLKYNPRSFKFLLLTLGLASLPMFAMNPARLHYVYSLGLPLVIIYFSQHSLKLPTRALQLLSCLLIVQVLNIPHWYTVYADSVKMEDSTIYNRASTYIKGLIAPAGTDARDDVAKIELRQLSAGVSSSEFAVEIGSIPEILDAHSEISLITYEEFINRINADVEFRNILAQQNLYPFGDWLAVRAKDGKIGVIGGQRSSSRTYLDSRALFFPHPNMIALPIFVRR